MARIDDGGGRQFAQEAMEGLDEVPMVAAGEVGAANTLLEQAVA